MYPGPFAAFTYLQLTHADWTRRAIGIRHRQSRRVRDGESSIFHIERPRNQPADRLRKRAPGSGTCDGFCGHIGPERIAPRFARAERQRNGCQPFQVLFDRQSGLVQAIGNSGPMIRAVIQLPESIPETGGVIQQMAELDFGRGAIGQRWPKLGNPFGDGIVETDLSAVNQCESCRGDDRLRKRGQAEDRVLPHGNCGLAIGETGGSPIDGLSVSRYHHHRAYDSLFGEGAIDGMVEFLRNRHSIPPETILARRLYDCRPLDRNRQNTPARP